MANAQTNEWAWIGGPQTPQQSVYGTLGTVASANLPPSRSAAVGWSDKKGNFWLFGGYSADPFNPSGALNDLWEYTPATGQWTWMAGNHTSNAAAVYGSLGVPAPGNTPASGYSFAGWTDSAVGWTDTNGNLWLFGSTGNELWQFNTATSEWTWVRGSTTPLCPGQACASPGVYGTPGVPGAANAPGARSSEVTWTDSHGNFWLFGGSGVDSTGKRGYLNDLWEFSPSTVEWTWMGGSNTITTCGSECGEAGTYGTLGTPAAGNIPGGRNEATGWTDGQGNLWLLGGSGLDSAGTFGLLNDLWEFNPSTREWTWIAGSNTYPAACTTPLAAECGAAGLYGTLQTPAAGNFPGARLEAASWTDGSGNLWLFGGDGIDSNGKWGFLDDLWKFDPSSHQWAWMSGSSVVSCTSVYCGQPGVYGTLQSPALGNSPSGRDLAVTGTDPRGNFWLFGGSGVNVAGVFGSFQDLWEFQPNTNGGLPVAATPVFSSSSGTYPTEQTIAIDDATPGTTIYYLVNGNTPALQYTAPLQVSASETIQAIAGAAGYANSDVVTASYTFSFAPAAIPVFTPASGTYVTAQTVSISATPGTTIYYTTDGTQPTSSSAVYGTPIAVSASETIQAIAVEAGQPSSATASAVYTISPSGTLGEWAWMGGSSQQNQPGLYGGMGSPAPSNIPGARNNASSWTDQSGNLWLFGGYGYDASGNHGNLNDLWEFNPAAAEWTWVGGSSTVPCTTFLQVQTCLGQSGVYGTLGTSSSANIPGGRSGSVGWTDSGGNRWLFGGLGIDSSGQSGDLNDLWKFDPVALTWTWMGGSNQRTQSGVYGTLGVPAAGNTPGSRDSAAAWTDKQGMFWLFGGTSLDITANSATLNDLWQFNPSTRQWAWMGGSNSVDVLVGSQPAVYGTLGVPGAGNNPGSLTGAASWTDSSGDFWLFGGGTLWKFNPSIGQWAWMSGAGAPDCRLDPLVGYQNCTPPPGVYGTLGLPDAANDPPGGTAAAIWTGHDGNFWLFGGFGSDVTGQNNGFYHGNLNTLWDFNPSANAWTWMGGDYAASNCSFLYIIPLPFVVCDGSQGVFGSPSIPEQENIPAARTGAATWTDKSGNFWLFSGQTTNFADEPAEMNDLWEYQPSANTLPPAATPVFSLKPGTYVTGGPVTISNGMANAKIYYTTDGTTPTSASKLYSGPLSVSTSESIRAVAIVPGYRNSSTALAGYVVEATATPAAPVISLAPGTYGSVQTVTLSDATAGATIFYSTDGTMPSPSSVYNGPITVSSSQTITAIAAFIVDSGYTVLDGIAVSGGGYVVSTPASAAYILNLPVPDFSFAVSPGTLTVAAGQSGTVALTITPMNGFNSAVSFSCAGLPPGTSCSFSPATVNPSGAAASTTLTLAANTTARNELPLRRPPFGSIAISTLALSLCFVGRRRRRLPSVWMVCIAATISLGCITACGTGSSVVSAGNSGSSGNTSTAEAGIITIAATSGSLSHSVPLSVSVN